jgi:hypothetical protein
MKMIGSEFAEISGEIERNIEGRSEIILGVDRNLGVEGEVSQN